MKNFSLKALGAFIFAAGLVIAGVAAPAQAATSGTISTNSFEASSTVATTVTIDFADTAPSSSTDVTINMQSLNVPSSCTVSPSTTLSDCGISVMTINGAAPPANTTVNKTNPVTLSVHLGTAASISAMSITFAANQLTVSQLPTGTRNIIWQAIAGGSAMQQTPFTVTAPPAASLSPSAVSITGTVGTPITPTAAFTPSNFVGAVTYSALRLPAGLSINSSTGVISGTPTAASTALNVSIRAIGATSGSVTITPTVNITGGSTPTDNSNSGLANTGINSATGISLLAGGLSLALVGAEMFMIARRKRSN